VNAFRLFLGACMHNMSLVNDMVNVLLNMLKAQASVNAVIGERDLTTVKKQKTFHSFIMSYFEMIRGIQALQESHMNLAAEFKERFGKDPSFLNEP